MILSAMNPMKVRRGNAVLSCTLLLCFTTGVASAAQETNKPLFTDQVWLCIGRGFVAIVPLARPQPLVVMNIDHKGIEQPERIATTGNEVFGLQCMGSHIELLVREGGSDHFSVLPFSVQDDGVRGEPREDINWSISRKPAMPSAIERRQEAFDWLTRAPGVGSRGNWYADVLGAFTPGHRYELHFIASRTQHCADLTVNLLEETLPSRKITKTVRLIRWSACSD